jgi:glycosyltransferase involved in cell wall biosynthesis
LHPGKKLKVLYIQAFPGGGSLIALYEMLRNIDATKIEPIVLCYYNNKYTATLEELEHCKIFYIAPGITAIYGNKRFGKLLNLLMYQVKQLNIYFFKDKYFVKQLFAFIKETRPDIIHHNNDAGADTHAVRASSKARIPQVIHNRSFVFFKNNPVGYLLNFILVRKSAFRINITAAVQSHYNELFRLSPAKSMVLHDFVDATKFKPQPASPALLNEFSIKPGDAVITNIGRITGWKGQHVLIEAINLIQHKIDNFKVLIVGPYDAGVGSETYHNQLTQMVTNYGLTDRIVFTGNRDDIPEIINASTVVVHTAIKPEPQGLVIIETLLCKKQVIVSDEGGSAEIARKYGGSLVKPSDPNALAEQLLTLVKGHSGVTFENDTKYKELLIDFDGSVQMQQIYNIYSTINKQA